MVNQTFLEAFFDWEFEGLTLDISDDISEETLIEAIYHYVEDDYEGLKDNLKSLFDYSSSD